MTNIYSYEYKKNSSKVGTFFAAFGVSIAVMVSQMGLVILILMIKMVQTAITSPNEKAYREAIDEIFNGSDFAAKISFFITVIGLAIILLIYYVNYVKGEQRRNTFESVIPKLMDKKRIAFIICIAISGFCLTMFLSVFISGLFPEKSESLTEAFENLKLSGVWYYVDVVLLGPIFEELVMRGLVMKISKKSFGMVGCMIINALMFSMLHGNVIQSFYVIPTGMVYAFLAFQFDSVIPTIFCHMFHNLLASMPDPESALGYIIYAVVMIVFAYLAYYFGRDQFPLFESYEDSTKQLRPAVPARTTVYAPVNPQPIRPVVQKPVTDPSADFSFFKNEVARPKPEPKPQLPKPASPARTAGSIWKVNLIYRQKVDTVMKNTKFTEKIFSSKELAEKWLAGKGFVYGQNSHFKPVPAPYWFHKNDTRADHVTVKIYEMKIDEGIKDDADKWLLKLNDRVS